MQNLTNFTPASILVCQQRQIGDVLLAGPALELLRERFPSARIDLFTEKKCAPLMLHNPAIDNFLLLDKAEQRTFPAQLAWYRRQTRQGYDLVIDFQQLPRCRMLTRFAAFYGAKVRLSFPAPWYRSRLYTHQTPATGFYAAETKASILAPLGLTWQGQAPRIFFTPEETAQAEIILHNLGLSPAQRLITVDATHRRASKRWGLERFARLIDLLAEARDDLRFLLLRGPGEEDEIQALRAACGNPTRILLPNPAPALRISAALIARAALHVGTCSAPRHIAVATDTPSVVIPGASGPEWSYPSAKHVELRPALPCQPCSKISCSDPRCLTEVSPQQAITACLALLDK